MYKLIYIILIISLCGCSAIAFPKITAPKKPDTVYSYDEKEKTDPQAVIDNGKVYVVNRQEKSLSVNYAKQDKKLSFMEKIGNWISGLGIFGIIAVIAGLILAPGATIAILIKVYKRMRKAFKETVTAIENSQAVNNDPRLKSELENTQDNATKKIVDDLKRE